MSAANKTVRDLADRLRVVLQQHTLAGLAPVAQLGGKAALIWVGPLAGAATRPSSQSWSAYMWTEENGRPERGVMDTEMPLWTPIDAVTIGLVTMATMAALELGSFDGRHFIATDERYDGPKVERALHGLIPLLLFMARGELDFTPGPEGTSAQDYAIKGVNQILEFHPSVEGLLTAD